MSCPDACRSRGGDPDRLVTGHGRLNLLEKLVDRQLAVVREVQPVFDKPGGLAADVAGLGSHGWAPGETTTVVEQGRKYLSPSLVSLASPQILLFDGTYG